MLINFQFIPSPGPMTCYNFSVDYGTKTFREKPEKFFGATEFNTVFKPIPEFDKLGEAFT